MVGSHRCHDGNSWHGNRVTRHGHRGGKRTPTYNSWRAMIYRCTYPNHPRYADYGGRGVKVCERWRSFTNFLADMGERPLGMTLDRINPHGDYTPDNARWATLLQQRWNRRNIYDAASPFFDDEAPSVHRKDPIPF